MKKPIWLFVTLVIWDHSLNGMKIESSSVLTQEFQGTSSDLVFDLTPNNAWHFEITSSQTPYFNRNIYFLEGNVTSIRSSPSLLLSFQTGYAYATAANGPKTAWYFDAGDNNTPSTANIYFLSGSIGNILHSPSLLLNFNGNSLNLAPTPIANQAWYYDGYIETSNLANIYYLSGSIDGIAHSSLTNLPFLGVSPIVAIDSNPSVAWYYDLSQLPNTGSDYYGNVYYLKGSEAEIHSSNPLTCTFHGSYTPLFADAAHNTAWYADSSLSTGNIATLYYLKGDLPNITETHRSFVFSTPYVNVTLNNQPNTAWYYNYYGDTAGFSGRIYYLEGSSIEIASSPSSSFVFQTHDALFTPSGRENRGWYFDRGFIDTAGFNGNIYYLSGSLDGINSSSATLPFQTQYAELVRGETSETAWYFDIAKDSIDPPFLSNVYYLSGSTEAITSSTTTLTFNTNSQNFLVDSSSGKLWLSDFGGLGTNFDGKIYYLSGSTSRISAINTVVPFSSSEAYLLSAGPNAVWYYDKDNPGNSVYYIKTKPGSHSLLVSSWTSGIQGALLNSVFNTTLGQIKTMNTRVSGRNPSSQSDKLSYYSVFSNDHLLANASDSPTYSKTHPKRDSQHYNSSYLLQIIPFYDFIHQKNQGSIPDFNNNIAGVLTTFDTKIDPFLLGGGLGYTYNQAHLIRGLGKAHINQEIVVVYTSWQDNRLFIGFNLWGGCYQLNGKRETAGNFTSKYTTQGYTLTPHLELKGSIFSDKNWLSFSPFLMGDWVFLWQNDYTEKGGDQISLKVPSQHSSLLRTEMGFYVQQFLRLKTGRVEFLEKVSYVNQLPFQQNIFLPLIAGSTPLFSIGTGTLSLQNLGAIELKSIFHPENPKMPFLGIDLQGEFGAKLSSYFVAIEAGWDF